ncbi:uncharacterized protein LOC142328183 isoform X2 [Lycorma delicatula]|uniref:uncharacterized protein LOC142328183 isoform X2 n=1 Tax=Lycorma delicatula TaxID=130591 RepID=UPI003F5148E2
MESELKAVIRSILISTPNAMNVKQLATEFMQSEGAEFPYNDFGFKTFLDYLKSIPDTVLLDSQNSINPLVIPVKSERSSHIDNLVMRQKKRTIKNKTSFFKSSTVRRPSSINVPQPLLNMHCSPPTQLKKHSQSQFNDGDYSATTNSEKGNSSPNFKKSTFPSSNSFYDEPSFNFKNEQKQVTSNKLQQNHSNDETNDTNSPGFKGAKSSSKNEKIVRSDLLNLIYHLCPHPQGCSLQEIESLVQKNFTIADVFDINDVVDDLEKYFILIDGVLYRKDISNLIQKRHCQNTNSSLMQTTTAAACTTVDDTLKDCDTKQPIWVPNTKKEPAFIPAGAECSMLNAHFYDSDSVSSDDSHRKINYLKNDRLNGVSVEHDYNSCNDNGDYDDFDLRISHKMKSNLKYLIKKYPYGIYCCDLPSLYEKEFHTTLNYEEYGYDCVIHMVNDLKSVFAFKRENSNSDWKLFDADSVKSDQFIDTNKTKKWISREMVQSICTVLAKNPKGLPLNLLCNKYKEVYGRVLPMQTIGFTSVESLVNNMSDYIHQRKVKDKILLYAKDNIRNFHDDNLKELAFSFAKGNDVELLPPLPDDEKLLAVLSCLYPEEVCGSGDRYTNQQLPEISDFKRLFEIRVSEVSTPHKFWIQLGSEYGKLDKMMEDLDDFYSEEEYNYKMPDMTIKPHQVCACTYDTKWHRTVVLKSCSAVDVKIEYVDYGTVDVVPKTRLRFLHKDFLELPAQAILAKLASILPPDGHKWPLQSCTKLLDMVSNKRLFMEACIINYNESVIEGVLYDTNSIEDIVINDVLANSGYAKFVSVGNDDNVNSSYEEDDINRKDLDLKDDTLNEDKLSSQITQFGISDKCYSPTSICNASNVESVVTDMIQKSYMTINKKLPDDIPFGEKKSSTGVYETSASLNMSLSSSVYNSSSANADLLSVKRPPPGFTPLNSNFNNGSVNNIPAVTLHNMLSGNAAPVNSAPLPSVPVQKHAFNDFNMFMDMLSPKPAEQFTSAPSNLFQPYNNVQTSANQKSHLTSYQQPLNTSPWNNYPTAGTGFLWGGISPRLTRPCMPVDPANSPYQQITSLPYGPPNNMLQQVFLPQQQTQMQQPFSYNNNNNNPFYMNISQPPLQPMFNNNIRNIKPLLPTFNQSFNNYNSMPSSYLPTPLQSTQKGFQQPMSNNLANTQPARNLWGAPLKKLSSSTLQVSSSKDLSPKQGKEQELSADVNKTVDELLSKINIKEEIKITNESATISNDNSSDDQKQNKLTKNQPEKTEKQLQRSSLFDSKTLNFNPITNHNDKTDTQSSDVNETNSDSPTDAEKNKDKGLCGKSNSSETCKEQTYSEEEQIKTNVLLSTPTFSQQSTNNLSYDKIASIKEGQKIAADSNGIIRYFDKFNSSDSAVNANVTNKSTSSFNYASLTLTNLRRPKILPNDILVNLLSNKNKDNENTENKSQISESLINDNNKVTTDNTSHTLKINNSITDEEVVDSWEELAEDSPNKNKVGNKKNGKEKENDIKILASPSKNKTVPNDKIECNEKEDGINLSTPLSSCSKDELMFGPVKSNTEDSISSNKIVNETCDNISSTLISLQSQDESKKPVENNNKSKKKLSKRNKKKKLNGNNNRNCNNNNKNSNDKNCNNNNKTYDKFTALTSATVTTTSVAAVTTVAVTVPSNSTEIISEPSPTSCISTSLLHSYSTSSDVNWKSLLPSNNFESNVDVVTADLNVTDSLVKDIISPNNNNLLTDMTNIAAKNKQLLENLRLSECKNETDNCEIYSNSFVLKKVVGDKTVHVFWHEGLLNDKRFVVATDELVKEFTQFSKRHSVIKALDCKQMNKPFYNIHKKDEPELFNELENFSISGVMKNGELMPDKLNVLPLNNVPIILETLSVDHYIINSFNVIIDELKFD